MKKFFKVILCIMAAVVLVLSLALAGCSKESSVVNAFKKAGYTVEVTNGKDAYTKLNGIINETDKDAFANYDYIECTKTSSEDGTTSTAASTERAVIIKYPSKKELKKDLDDRYADSYEDGRIKGDCYLVDATAKAFSVFESNGKGVSGKVKSMAAAFEKEDYDVTVITGSELMYYSMTGTGYKNVIDRYMTGESAKLKKKCAYLICTKGNATNAIIFVFPTKEKLKECCGDGYSYEKEQGKINGVFYMVSGNAAEKQIFATVK